MITFLSDEVLSNCSPEITLSMGSFQKNIQTVETFFIFIYLSR